MIACMPLQYIAYHCISTSRLSRSQPIFVREIPYEQRILKIWLHKSLQSIPHDGPSCPVNACDKEVKLGRAGFLRPAIALGTVLLELLQVSMTLCYSAWREWISLLLLCFCMKQIEAATCCIPSGHDRVGRQKWRGWKGKLPRYTDPISRTNSPSSAMLRKQTKFLLEPFAH